MGCASSSQVSTETSAKLSSRIQRTSSDRTSEAPKPTGWAENLQEVAGPSPDNNCLPSARQLDNAIELTQVRSNKTTETQNLPDLAQELEDVSTMSKISAKHIALNDAAPTSIICQHGGVCRLQAA
ncbi:hypothetical protein CEUSTIGMA_g6502.t1 [Chlamydomonas eustigma]|uniref:Uncharacterized protein n=1 Tax=Chlamydomonas eustigma TaxID=1157962 RepID=A0A250X846_9CHLO|nr:hypothetical protein CEUSTIGMA_g6502.t1 [Chlamydomonas eustigma]|eukprot:GAX79062.1 hypothetical protein CEUSTIGMA_g6502.t1 [Chlamydomonas eustigma]